MFLLRLFHRSDPAQPVAAHMLGEGITRVGRDPAVDWPVPDPECEMSRHHLDLVYEDGALAVRALGANGVIDCATGKRLPDEEAVALALGDAVEFGPYRMVVDSVPFATQAGASFERTIVFSGPLGGHRAIPTDWADGVETGQASEEGSLLEAFCEGAGLDVSALSGEEPDEIMRRAGAIYRQMVLGLGELVNERSAARAARDIQMGAGTPPGDRSAAWAAGGIPDRPRRDQGLFRGRTKSPARHRRGMRVGDTGPNRTPRSGAGREPDRGQDRDPEGPRSDLLGRISQASRRAGSGDGGEPSRGSRTGFHHGL